MHSSMVEIGNLADITCERLFPNRGVRGIAIVIKERKVDAWRTLCIFMRTNRLPESNKHGVSATPRTVHLTNGIALLALLDKRNESSGHARQHPMCCV